MPGRDDITARRPGGRGTLDEARRLVEALHDLLAQATHADAGARGASPQPDAPGGAAAAGAAPGPINITNFYGNTPTEAGETDRKRGD